LVLDPHLKALGLIQTFQPTILLEFIGAWALDPHLKLPSVHYQNWLKN
jgi:hypothetical protein